MQPSFSHHPSAVFLSLKREAQTYIKVPPPYAHAIATIPTLVCRPILREAKAGLQSSTY